MHLYALSVLVHQRQQGCVNVSIHVYIKKRRIWPATTCRESPNPFDLKSNRTAQRRPLCAPWAAPRCLGWEHTPLLTKKWKSQSLLSFCGGRVVFPWGMGLFCLLREVALLLREEGVGGREWAAPQTDVEMEGRWRAGSRSGSCSGSRGGSCKWSRCSVTKCWALASRSGEEPGSGQRPAGGSGPDPGSKEDASKLHSTCVWHLSLCWHGTFCVHPQPPDTLPISSLDYRDLKPEENYSPLNCHQALIRFHRWEVLEYSSEGKPAILLQKQQAGAEADARRHSRDNVTSRRTFSLLLSAAVAAATDRSGVS